MAREQSFGARAPGDAHHLVLLLHGTAYRRGGHHTKNSSDDELTLTSQGDAFDSLRRHVIEPAVEASWSVELLIDVDVPPLLAARLDSEVWSH